MNAVIFSPRMKMAELIISPELLSVIERLEIRMGFGDVTIEHVCQQYGLSPNLFLMICSIYASDSFVPNVDQLSETDVPHIVSFLAKTHQYWLGSCFPQLHTQVHAMLDACDDLSKKILNKFYDDYDAEVKKHLDYEENTVFPYILSLSQNGTRNQSLIHDFEKNHGEFDEKLNDLKNIVVKYLPEQVYSPARGEVLNLIFRIESDLKKHTFIEHHLLIPLVQRLV